MPEWIFFKINLCIQLLQRKHGTGEIENIILSDFRFSRLPTIEQIKTPRYVLEK